VSTPERRRAVLIAGPTASGKSALALARAARSGGLIVNADAMQVYDGLSILTARPQAPDLARAEHALYGVIDPAVRFSTGAWLEAARAVIAQSGVRELIFVGGTGLYFEALTNGIATIPPVPEAIVQAIAAEVAPLDRQQRFALLAARDPDMVERLKEPDAQRLVRALSVKAATGQSLAHFTAAGQSGLLDGFAVERVVLRPDRALLRERIARRLQTMWEEGARAEVEALLALGLDPSLPAMKAIGVPEIAGWLAGRLTSVEAMDLAVTATRQYAKRQSTWFRNRMGDWPGYDPFAESLPPGLLS